jgi:alkanesulfonate monooxygenase SsuD/methylene tetrahydromethanopterin reductase-like flavin-dependent oxidoreductase (luciferase family)
MPSAKASAARSSRVNKSLDLKSATAAIFSADAPALLLPTALVSIQNGHPAICATRRQTIDLISGGSVLLRAGAAPRFRLASRMGGQYA